MLYLLYRLLEKIDGESSNIHIITYRKAETLKLWVLINLIED